MASNKQKRKPTPPGQKSSGSKEKTGVASTTRAKDENKTVFNSAVDNKLATIDVYGPLGTTVNSLYQFTNTMSFDSINTVLKGGLNGLNKITGYLKEAKKIKDTFQNGNLMDKIGAIAPGAKGALSSFGLTPDLFDKFQAAAQIGVNVSGTVQKIKNGDLDILNGMNSLAKTLTGTDLAIINDIQSIKGAVAGIITEFSNAGIAIKNEWDSLVKADSNKGGWNISTDVAIAVLPGLANNGDYSTMLHAIKGSDPQRMEAIGGQIVEKMLKEFSRNSVFNQGRKEEDIFKDVMDVIYAFRGGESLWINRTPPANNRKAFNLYLFLIASPDFKEVAKTALSKRFYKDPQIKKTIQYADKENEVLILMTSLFSRVDAGNPFNEFRKDFPEFIINPLNKVSDLVTPNDFRPNNY